MVTAVAVRVLLLLLLLRCHGQGNLHLQQSIMLETDQTERAEGRAATRVYG